MPSYNTFLSNTQVQASSNKAGGGGSDGPWYGRVWDVILDDKHPKWKEMGYSQAQYGVFYTVPAKGRNKEGEDLAFAYYKGGPIKRIPIRNEIVSLTSDLCTDIKNDTDYYGYRTYWTDIIPVWNHIHLNAYPDKKLEPQDRVDTGKDFKEKDDINPLQLCPGDMSFEGRHGQSIRFGGTQYTESKIATTDRNGNPYIIFRCGQGVKAQEGSQTIFEDVNKDSASIYVMSGHKVGLEQANSIRTSWKRDVTPDPEKASEYEKPQIIFNAGRLWLNARDTDIELSAKDSVGINSGKNVCIDAGKYSCIDSPKIYLGAGAHAEQEPVVRGQTAIEWESRLCTTLDMLIQTMATAPSTTPWEAAVMGAAVNTTKDLKQLKATLKPWLSKKSFVE